MKLATSSCYGNAATPPYVTDIIGIHNSIYLTLTLNLYSYLCANPEQFPDQNADQVACDVS